jgi:hypothetical protein
LLYAGTEFGMFISFDNGAHWQPFQLNLPATPITDIKVYQKNLIVSTQGRSIWMIDNVTALHQLSPQVMPTSPYLFKPRDGYRTRVSPDRLGPMIEYYLPAVPAGPVVMEILDAKGALVNRYTSDAPAAAAGGGRGGRAGGAGAAAAGAAEPPPVDPDAAPPAGFGGRGGGGAASRVTKVEGMNRFVWDVRHQNGLGAPPASYQARLTVDGKTFTQPFAVLIDPPLAEEGLTAADIQGQFDHNVKMRELSAQVTQVLTRVRTARQAAASDPKLSAALTAIYERLVATPEGVRYNKPGLQQHVSYLAGMTTGVDQKVGKDALDRYAALKKELDGIAAELDKLIGK